MAVFNPVLARDPANPTAVVYSQNYFPTLPNAQPGLDTVGLDPLSPSAQFKGCDRETYGGNVLWNNVGGTDTYYTDVYGDVKAGPGPGLITQRVSRSQWSNPAAHIPKLREGFCWGSGVHAPN